MFLAATIVLLFLAEEQPALALWIAVLVLVVLQRGNIFTNLVNIGQSAPAVATGQVKGGLSSSSQGG